MILRSASTPILSSLLPTHTESPIHSSSFVSPINSTHTSPKKCPRKKRVSFQPTTPRNPISPTSACAINTPSPSFKTERPNASGKSRMRRAQSEGNLGGLVSAACKSFDEFASPTPTSKKFPRKTHCPVLQPIEDSWGEEGEEEDKIAVKSRMVGDECLSLEMAYMRSKGLDDVAEKENLNVPSKMHLARGLGSATLPGLDDGGSGRGRFGSNNRSGTDVKEHYKKMVEENPGDSLFLSNYAQFLHQANNLEGAEEYYARAILADPGDSQILSGYANVIWELHHDEERASSYYQRALQSAPADSQVLAGYASFLWETQQDNWKPATSTPLVSENQGQEVLI